MNCQEAERRIDAAKEFERAKTFSDFLGFHIRLVAFLIFSLLCIRLGFQRLGDGVTTSDALWAIAYTLTALLFFVYSVRMFFHIFQVTVNFFEIRFGGRIAKVPTVAFFVSLVVSIFVLTIVFNALFELAIGEVAF